MCIRDRTSIGSRPDFVCMFGSAGGPARPDGARTLAFLGSRRPLLVMSPSLRDLAHQPTARACVVRMGARRDLLLMAQMLRRYSPHSPGSPEFPEFPDFPGTPYPSAEPAEPSQPWSIHAMSWPTPDDRGNKQNVLCLLLSRIPDASKDGKTNQTSPGRHPMLTNAMAFGTSQTHQRRPATPRDAPETQSLRCNGPHFRLPRSSHGQIGECGAPGSERVPSRSGAGPVRVGGLGGVCPGRDAVAVVAGGRPEGSVGSG